jgi:hypothetical protein
MQAVGTGKSKGSEMDVDLPSTSGDSLCGWVCLANGLKNKVD